MLMQDLIRMDKVALLATKKETSHPLVALAKTTTRTACRARCTITEA
jgi:hypothetical protein